jgi:tetratricopeptide (TPR) repeat protein
MRPATPLHGGDFIDRVSVNPFDPVALNNLAISEAAKGRYQQALMLLQRAVKLAPARPDIAANLQSLQRWLALAEGQAAIGIQPQPLALPYQDNLVPDVPPLWQPPPTSGSPQQGLRGNGAAAITQPPAVANTPTTSAVKPGANTRLPIRPTKNSK